MFTDKYNLTPEQNLFLAKKKWDENVYCGMRMENNIRGCQRSKRPYRRYTGYFKYA